MSCGQIWAKALTQPLSRFWVSSPCLLPCVSLYLLSLSSILSLSQSSSVCPTANFIWFWLRVLCTRCSCRHGNNNWKEHWIADHWTDYVAFCLFTFAFAMKEIVNENCRRYAPKRNWEVYVLIIEVHSLSASRTWTFAL